MRRFLLYLFLWIVLSKDILGSHNGPHYIYVVEHEKTGERKVLEGTSLENTIVIGDKVEVFQKHPGWSIWDMKRIK